MREWDEYGNRARTFCPERRTTILRCQKHQIKNRSNHHTIAKEVADTFANAGNGFTQEANDNMAFFALSGAVSGSSLSGSALHSSAISYTMVLNLGVERVCKINCAFSLSDKKNV